MHVTGRNVLEIMKDKVFYQRLSIGTISSNTFLKVVLSTRVTQTQRLLVLPVEGTIKNIKDVAEKLSFPLPSPPLLSPSPPPPPQLTEDDVEENTSAFQKIKIKVSRRY